MDYSSDGSLSSTASHSDQGQALSSQAPQSYGASLTHRPAPMQPTLNVQPLTHFASSAAYMTAKSAPTGTRNNMAHNQQPGTLNAPINNSATSSRIQQPAASIENNLLDWCKAQGYVSHDIQLLPPSKKSSEKWALDIGELVRSLCPGGWHSSSKAVPEVFQRPWSVGRVHCCPDVGNRQAHAGCLCLLLHE
jgi:hypothetical protein